ncbi:aldolase/citrate lyase family protein [Dactylosporangium sp. NPDC050688]|uniref:aldolase/citrate lyase family protein n=1 Tax=Dactylosporangium sp. NPDC050688 TaxID=3157217 RepID=UPI0033CCF012
MSGPERSGGGDQRRRGAGFLGTAVLTPTADPVVVELLARDVDAVILDLEHGAIADADAGTAAVVAHANGARIAIRVAVSEPARAARFLDAGGDGVIAARVDDTDTARAWVAAVSPPPRGHRGVGATRATRYGRRAEVLGPPWVCAQIETGRGLAELEQIAGVPGIDALLVGERDLSYALGIPGELAHPQIAAAHVAVVEAARRHGLSYVAVSGRLTAAVAVPDLLILAFNTVIERGIREVRS